MLSRGAHYFSGLQVAKRIVPNTECRKNLFTLSISRGVTNSTKLVLLNASSKCYKHKTSQVRTFLSDKERVRGFVSRLNVDERRLLIQELNEQAKDGEERAQCVDGEVKGDTSAEPRVPTYSELRQVAIHQSLPFVGFGFLDNLIMIIAGDYIDLTLGVTFGISTMAAAGLGNALSDVAGLGSAFYVERISDKIGVRSPNFTLAQLQMTRTRWATQIGRAIGITIGCLIGMFPLLFLPNKVAIANDAAKTEDDEEREN